MDLIKSMIVMVIMAILVLAVLPTFSAVNESTAANLLRGKGYTVFASNTEYVKRDGSQNMTGGHDFNGFPVLFDVAGSGVRIQDGGAELLQFRDSTVTGGLDITLTAAGSQTITPTSGNLVINGTLEAATGRTATFTVCGTNASALSIAQCDYTADGTLDDVEIQAAIAALPASGGKVLLIGTFTVGAIITIPDDTTVEMLAGGLISPIVGGRSVFRNEDYAGVAGNSRIRLLNIRVNDTNQTVSSGGRGIIDFASVHEVWVEGCILLNAHETAISIWSGGGITRNSQIVITNNYIENPIGTTVGTGISLGITDDFIISNNVFKDITGAAAAIGPDESTRGTIVGNVIDVARDGIVIEGSATPPTDITIAGNSVWGNDPAQAGWGIAIMESGTRNTIVGNTVRDFGTGVRLVGVDENVVQGNHISSIAGSGILLIQSGADESERNVIADNISVDNTYGIRSLSSSDGNIYTGNVLRNNSTANMATVDTTGVVRNNFGHVVSGDIVTIVKVIDHAALTDNADATAYMDMDDAIPAGSSFLQMGYNFTQSFNSDDTTTLTLMAGYVGDLDAFSLTADPGDNAFNHTTDVYYAQSDAQAHRVTTAQTPRITFTEDNDGTDIINSANAQGAIVVTMSYIKG